MRFIHLLALPYVTDTCLNQQGPQMFDLLAGTPLLTLALPVFAVCLLFGVYFAVKLEVRKNITN
ncbi:hypothetical protein GCM10009077_32000 [Roseibium denhamense]